MTYKVHDRLRCACSSDARAARSAVAGAAGFVRYRFLKIFGAVALVLLLATALFAGAGVAAENTSITTWDELEQNITAWGTNTEMLTIKLAVPLTNTSGDNHPGIQVRGHVTIMPASSSGEEVVIDARQHGRIFNVVEGGNLTLTGNGSRVLNVTGGYMSVEGACGGGIYVQSGNLTLAKGAIISNCSAMNHNGVSSGGGVYVANGGNFTMYGGNISNCSAYNNGGGVYVCDGNFTMYGGNISGCSADKGCGVYVCDGNFTMYGGAISNCSAPYGGSMGGGVYVYSEESVSNFIMYGGNISGCSAPKGGGVYVYSEESVSNFIMYGGNISGCSAYSNGGGVYVANGGNFTMYGGNISNCSAQYGGGVFVAKDCTFTMYGGAISGCSASASGERAVAYGGGVYVYDGTFTLSGGAITNCSASVSGEHAVASGGGVYICSEESVSNFIMSGGAISNCSASASGGVAVASGGGVFVYDGTFNLSGGTISNCSAGWYGGGVDVNGGTFTMYGGAISNCSARGGIVAYGGGVYVDEDCTFTMYGGNISGCSACYGGGVYLMASKKEMNGGGNFIMSGGNISGCSASSGAAVFNKGTFTVNGTAQVAADNDVALIKISVPRSRESTIYNIIALPSFTGNILNISLLTEEDGNIAHNPGRWMPDPRFGPSVVVQGGAAASGAFALSKLSAYKSFVLEDYIDDLILGDYKPPYVEVSTWAELSRNVSEWTDQKTQRVVVVTDNISREDGDDDNIFVYGNVLVTANYSDVASEVRIDGKGAGRIFEVEEDGGNLTLIGNGSKVLNVTGGDGDTENGGGILVKPNANLTLADGAIISNCSSTGMYGGGGVYVMDRGRFTMLGGSIIGCSATKDGGGVYVDPNGIFTMYGGNISGCNATGVSASGGGVYVNNGNFTMYGGSIIGCSAAVSGGGVYVEDSMFNVEGAAQITGNTAGDKTTANNVYASNVYLSSNNLLQLIGDFTGSIGIVNVSGEAPAADAQFGTATGVYNGAERFFADTDPAMVGSRNESNALVWTKRLDPYVEVSSWDQLSRNVSEWTSAAQRVVVVAGNISRTDAENPDGIAVYGNVLVTTNNSGAGEVRIDGKGAGRIFEVKTGGNLTLIGNGSKVLNVTGGYTSSTGGGISVASGSNLTLAKNAVLSNCSATKNGGGVYVYNGGIFSMSGGTISGSNATQNGGGVYVCNGGIFSMSGGNISGCYATQNGGGVFLMSGAAPANGGIFNMSGGNISGCSATKNGGGVYVSTGGIFSMSGGNISGCHAPFGAAVYNSGAFTVSGSAQVAADNDAALVVEMTIPFPKQSTTTYHNLTAGSSFNGKIQNISLLKKSGSGPTLSHSHNLTAWLNQVVVQNGAAATEAGATFALSTLSNYSGYALVKNGTNLTLGKYLSPYVEVSSWDQLSQRVSEWTSAAQRVVVVTGNITDRGAQDPTGISVRGNVLVTTNNSGAGEVRIDGKGAGRIFNVLGGGNLTLIGNESKVLNVTGGYMGEEGGGIWVESNSNLTLAKNAVISNCSATKGGGVFIAPASELGGAGTFTMSNSSITGCKAGQGGGVFNNYGTFTMSNSSISGCNASGNDGGGVYNDGTFNMSGSSITDCSAADGGGVGINIGGTFIMNSSSISGCSASGTKGGGGVYIDKDGTFIMNSSSITNCSATNGGGGVYISEVDDVGGTFIMTDSNITGCSASGMGGGVYVSFGCTFTMFSGNITGCNASGMMGGGGVCNYGTFTMFSGNISGCSASGMGGGVCNVVGTFNMSGGKITDCRAPFGAGVINAGLLAVNGTAQVAADNDVALVNATGLGLGFCNIVVDPSFRGNVQNISLFNMTSSPSFNPDPAGWLNQTVVQNGAAATAAGATFALSKLPAYSGYALVKNGTNLTLGKYLSPYVEVSSWAELSQRVSEWTSAEQRVVVVTGNITDRDTAEEKYSDGIAVYGNVLVTTNSSGVDEVRIDGKGAGRIFKVETGGNLTLIGNGSKVLNVTGGYVSGIGGNGGGILVDSNATLTLAKNATISNSSADSGGGVSVYRGNFTMSGGNIIGCRATIANYSGGGVYLYDNASFTMSGGTIVGCRADFGGGVVVDTNCNFTMSGGSIVGCNAGRGGGGVYIEDGTFTQSGGSIAGCNATDYGGGVYVFSGNFTMSGGSITGCNATGSGAYGGAVNVANDGNFTMSGGTIRDCRAGLQGGGVDNYGKFTMLGGNISDCFANVYGGGVITSGTFTLSGGNITRCSTSGIGGGVLVSIMLDFTPCDSTFIMNGGNITDCQAAMGAGVGNLMGIFAMSGGNISGCSAPFGGSGVGNAGYFAISGTAQISADNDVAQVWLNLSPMPVDLHCNITVDQSYNGKVQNITLFNLTSITSPIPKEDPAGWLNHTVVQYGAVHKDNFTLAPHLTSAGYYLTPGTGDKANDLVLAKTNVRTVYVNETITTETEDHFQNISGALKATADKDALIILETNVTLQDSLYISPTHNVTIDGQMHHIKQGFTKESLENTQNTIKLSLTHLADSNVVTIKDVVLNFSNNPGDVFIYNNAKSTYPKAHLVNVTIADIYTQELLKMRSALHIDGANVTAENLSFKFTNETTKALEEPDNLLEYLVSTIDLEATSHEYHASNLTIDNLTYGAYGKYADAAKKPVVINSGTATAVEPIDIELLFGRHVAIWPGFAKDRVHEVSSWDDLKTLTTSPGKLQFGDTIRLNSYIVSPGTGENISLPAGILINPVAEGGKHCVINLTATDSIIVNDALGLAGILGYDKAVTYGAGKVVAGESFINPELLKDNLFIPPGTTIQIDESIAEKQNNVTITIPEAQTLVLTVDGNGTVRVKENKNLIVTGKGAVNLSDDPREYDTALIVNGTINLYAPVTKWPKFGVTGNGTINIYTNKSVIPASNGVNISVAAFTLKSDKGQIQNGTTIVNPATELALNGTAWDIYNNATMKVGNVNYTLIPTTPGYSGVWEMDAKSGKVSGVGNLKANFTANVTKVIFHNATGIQENKSYTYKGAVTMPAVPTKQGFTFAGWNVSEGSSWKPFNSSEYNASGIWNYTGAESSLDVYANWTAVAQYNITNNTVNGTVTPSATKAAAGATIHVTAVADSGYHFADWNVTNATAKIDVKDGNFTMPASDVNAGANFTANVTNVIFHNATGVQEQKSYTYLGKVTMPAVPTKQGFTFAGWNVSVDEDGWTPFNSSSYNDNGIWKYTNASGKALHVYANWTAVAQYTITNSTVNGTVTPSATKAAAGATIHVTAKADSGYHFADWNVTNATAKIDVKDGNFTMPASDVNAGANFTANVTNVIFHNATGVQEQKSYTYLGKVTMPAVPTKQGFTFAGWNVSVGTTWASFNSSSYNDNGIWKYTNASGTALHVYANWTAVAQYTITNNTVNGTVTPSATKAAAGATIHVMAKADDGYHFADWNVTNATAKLPVDASGNFTMPASDVNAAANFTANVTNVIFHNATGVQEQKSYTYKGAVTMPAVPTKQGFTFAGWNVSVGKNWENFNSSAYNDNGIWKYTNASGTALNVYANWSAVAQYTITNSTVNGTVTPSATKAAAGATIHVTAVADSGYHFADWNVTNATAKIDVKDGNFTMPASDVNAGANFTANVTKVIFHNATGIQEQKSYTYKGAVTMPAVPTKQGFTFAGWNVSVGQSWENFNSSAYNDNGTWKYTNASGTALHVYANWTAVAQYNITNSTVNGTVTPSATKAAAGATIHVTAVADRGYHFADWNVTNATAKIDVKDGNFTMPASDVNAAANFTANVTNVIFHNATGIQEQKSYTYKGAVTMPAVPSKEGFTFIGWNVSVGQSWENFNSSAYNDNGIWKYTGVNGSTLNVYAAWTPAEILVTTNTISLGTYDINGQNSSALHDGSVNITNNMPESITVINDNPEIFTISPVSSDIPSLSTKQFTVTLNDAAKSRLGDHVANLSIKGEPYVRLTVSVVDTTEHKTNTTVIPGLPEIETEVKEIEGKEVITNITVKEENVKIDTSGDVTNATISNDITSDKVVEIHITDIENISGGAGKEKIILKPNSTVTTTYPVTKADLITRNAVKVEYKANISLYALTSSAPPTLTGDFDEDVSTTVKNTMKTERLNVNVLSMVSSVNKEVDKFNNQIKELTLTFEIPASSVTSKDRLKAYHVKNGKADKLNDNNVTVSDKTWSAGQYVYFVTIKSGYGFSSYVVGEESSQPAPSPTSGGGGGGQSGSSVWITPTPTITPTVTPTATPIVTPTIQPTSTVQKTTTPTANPTKTPASPLMFAGILAGLGAAAAVCLRRR